MIGIDPSQEQLENATSKDRVTWLCAPGAILALISYGVLGLNNDALNERFDTFYGSEIGPFWPPERKLVDSGYADIDFPFEELPAPRLTLLRDWDLTEFLGYVSTWSAVRRAIGAGEQNILSAFATEISELWGPPAITRRISWPINMRIGRV